MFGNGLRPQIWSSFVSRFDIPMIIESYASTEGMLYAVSYYGSENKNVLKIFDSNITITAVLLDSKGALQTQTMKISSLSDESRASRSTGSDAINPPSDAECPLRQQRFDPSRSTCA